MVEVQIYSDLWVGVNSVGWLVRDLKENWKIGGKGEWRRDMWTDFQNGYEV